MWTKLYIKIFEKMADDWDKDLNRTSANVRKMNTPPRTDVDDFMDKVNKR